MDAYKDFTWSPTNFPQSDMQQFVQSLHGNGQHYVVIVDPGIHNESGYAPYAFRLTLVRVISMTMIR